MWMATAPVHAVGGQFNVRRNGFAGTLLRLRAGTWTASRLRRAAAAATRSGAGRRYGSRDRGSRHRGTGRRWTGSLTERVDTRRDLHALAATGDQRGLCVGDGGVVIERTTVSAAALPSLEAGAVPVGRASPWQAVDGIPTDRVLWSIWGEEDRLFAVGGRWAPSSPSTASGWLAHTAPSPLHLHGVWGRRADQVYAVGDFATVIEFDGSHWREIHRLGIDVSGRRRRRLRAARPVRGRRRRADSAFGRRRLRAHRRTHPRRALCALGPRCRPCGSRSATSAPSCVGTAAHGTVSPPAPRRSSTGFVRPGARRHRRSRPVGCHRALRRAGAGRGAPLAPPPTCSEVAPLDGTRWLAVGSRGTALVWDGDAWIEGGHRHRRRPARGYGWRRDSTGVRGRRRRHGTQAPAVTVRSRSPYSAISRHCGAAVLPGQSRKSVSVRRRHPLHPLRRRRTPPPHRGRTAAMNISDLLLPNELGDEATSPGTGCSRAARIRASRRSSPPRRCRSSLPPSPVRYCRRKSRNRMRSEQLAFERREEAPRHDVVVAASHRARCGAAAGSLGPRWPRPLGPGAIDLTSCGTGAKSVRPPPQRHDHEIRTDGSHVHLARPRSEDGSPRHQGHGAARGGSATTRSPCGTTS